MTSRDCYVSCDIQESLNNVWGSWGLLDSLSDRKGIIRMPVKTFLNFPSDGLTWNRNDNEKNDTKIC